MLALQHSEEATLSQGTHPVTVRYEGHAQVRRDASLCASQSGLEGFKVAWQGCVTERLEAASRGGMLAAAEVSDEPETREDGDEEYPLPQEVLV